MRKWHTQVSTVVANVGRELSLLKMAINMANADYPSFFLWNELELPTAGNGVPGVKCTETARPIRGHETAGIQQSVI